MLEEAEQVRPSCMGLEIRIETFPSTYGLLVVHITWDKNRSSHIALYGSTNHW